MLSGVLIEVGDLFVSGIVFGFVDEVKVCFVEYN